MDSYSYGTFIKKTYHIICHLDDLDPRNWNVTLSHPRGLKVSDGADPLRKLSDF